MRTLGTVVVVLLLAGHALVRAGQDEAVAAYQRGDYATALKEFRALAQQGHYLAQSIVGSMYRDGQGVPQDYREAMKWYRRAADQGEASAQYNLGLMYDEGHGVPQDYKEAVKWYQNAAGQGFALAEYNLGVSYAKGQGVPQDYVQAHMWFNIAGANGHENATEYRDTVATLMTPAQISKAQQLAGEWMKQHR